VAKKVSSRKTKVAAAKKPARKTAKKAARKKPKQAKKTAKRARRLKRSPLKARELTEFRNILLTKRRDLLGDMSGIEAEALRKDRKDIASDLSTLPTHPADIGTDNFEQEFTLGLLESERVLLDEIDAALQRIDEGTFGICAGTGKPIGKARLKARPWARYCIEYAHMIEKGLVRPEEENEYDQDDLLGEQED